MPKVSGRKSVATNAEDPFKAKKRWKMSGGEQRVARRGRKAIDEAGRVGRGRGRIVPKGRDRGENVEKRVAGGKGIASGGGV